MFPFAPGSAGVAAARFAVLFTSTTHGEEAVPQVFPALHNDAGSGSVQAYLLAFWALAELATITIGSTSKVNLLAKLRKFFIFRLAYEFLQRRKVCGSKIVVIPRAR